MDMNYASQQSGTPMDAFLQMQAQSQQLPMSMQQFPDPTQQYMADNSYMMAADTTNYPMPHPHMAMQQFPPQVNGSEPEDKRRKGSSATATNDKELRELLVRNEGRALPEVAQEVIAKERTPQAEKTKQLFAMLWYVSRLTVSYVAIAVFILDLPLHPMLANPLRIICSHVSSSGFARFAKRPRRLFHATESTLTMRLAAAPNA